MSSVLAGSPALLRALNERAIIDVLHRSGPLARPELVTSTRLSRTTVTQTVAALLDTGAIAEGRLDHARKGPAARLYEIAPDAAFGLAAQIGATNVRVAIIDLSGTRRADAAAPADAGDTVDLIASLTAHCMRFLNTELGFEPKLSAAVVGVSGIVGADRRTVREVPDYGPARPHLHRRLESILGCTVELENDVNLAAIAEHRSGVAQDLQDFAVLSLDSGVGSALMFNGRLHRGAAGGAGEVGYLPQPGIALGHEVIGASAIAELATVEGLDPSQDLEHFLGLAEEGDSAALSLIAVIGKRLALLAGSIALVVEPEVMVLGGNAAHPALVDAVHSYTKNEFAALPLTFRESQLGAEAPLLGAAKSVHDRIRDVVLDAVAPIEQNGRPA